MIFKAVEGNTHETLIKRVIGLPGNKIELRHGKLFLNGPAAERALCRQ